MASDDGKGKQPRAETRPETRPETRFWGGPRPIGALLPAVTRPAFRQRAPAGAQLMADWPDIIGPALAAVTEPRRLVGGTLTLACAGPIALELQHLTSELAARINGHLGRQLVERFRFVQDRTASSAVRERPVRRVPPAPVPVPGVPPGALHDALAQLGGAVAQARQPGKRERS